ncbi:hypothetical protein [Compostibacter hankyongensis]
MRRYNYMQGALLPVFLLLAVAQQGQAQVLPSFPYSALGVGEFNYNTQGMLSGMGYGVSAVRSGSFLNNANPAAYSALQPHLSLGELSATGLVATLQSGSSTGQSSDFNVSRFAIGIKVNKWWGTSVGLIPVSTMSYQIVDDKAVTGTSKSINSIYEGNGGLHAFYWGNGIKIGNHLSLGVQMNYIFGSLNQMEKIAYDISNPLLTSTQQTFLRNLDFSYGLQYFTPITDRLDMSVGLQYQGRRDLRASYTLSIVSGGDTLSDETMKDDYFTLPDQYRAGIAFTFDDMLTVDFDYIFEKWNDLSVKSNNVSLVNSVSYGLGLQWFPGGKDVPYRRLLQQRLLFEGGVNYNRSYLQIDQKQISDLSLSLGAGLYNRPGNLSLGVGLEVGQKGTMGSGLINESYTKLYLTLIVRNIWLTKHKYY